MVTQTYWIMVAQDAAIALAAAHAPTLVSLASRRQQDILSVILLRVSKLTKYIAAFYALSTMQAAAMGQAKGKPRLVVLRAELQR